MNRRPFAIALSLCLVVGCGGPASDPTILYDGAPTDEALAQMLALPLTSGATLTVVSPAAEAELDAGTPLSVEFAEGVADLTQPKGTPRLARRPAATDAGRWVTRAVQALDAMLGVGTAHAHGTPYNGVAYLLEFADASQVVRLRVFTDQTSFTIPEDEWTALGASADPLTLTISSATFEQNDVVSGGGPFERASVAFSID